jgi:hypothetical protein
MPYEMGALLHRCEADDFAILITQLDSYVNVSADSELKELLTLYRNNGEVSGKSRLVELLEREIRYAGSSDLA